jgi:hypothetical protein
MVMEFVFYIVYQIFVRRGALDKMEEFRFLFSCKDKDEINFDWQRLIEFPGNKFKKQALMHFYVVGKFSFLKESITS